MIKNDNSYFRPTVAIPYTSIPATFDLILSVKIAHFPCVKFHCKLMCCRFHYKFTGSSLSPYSWGWLSKGGWRSVNSSVWSQGRGAWSMKWQVMVIGLGTSVDIVGRGRSYFAPLAATWIVAFVSRTLWSGRYGHQLNYILLAFPNQGLM